jgi:hypothetical protein
MSVSPLPIRSLFREEDTQQLHVFLDLILPIFGHFLTISSSSHVRNLGPFAERHLPGLGTN